MTPATPRPDEDPALARERLKKKMTMLGIGLLIAGAAVLLLLRRIPLPLRLLIGFGDLIAGATLLLVARQKFGSEQKEKPRNTRN